MSGCGDDNPDDERREAARGYTKSVSRRADGAKAALVLGVSERQCYRIKARVTRRGARGVVHGNRGRPSKRKVKEKTLKRIVELEERRKRRVRLFGMVEKVWEKNKKEKPEVIEREVQEAVRAVRARAAPRRR